MNTLKPSPQLASWIWNGGQQLIAGVGTGVGGPVSVINASAAFYEEQEADERSLSFEERLQRSGGIRYR